MTIERFPLALKSELREVDRNLKREVANLNLQFEANKRVKNGVTFGTNFADSFGMEIDTARTSSDEALSIGQTIINVQDTSQFESGTEVTVFDDVNMERVNITSINGNEITLKTALAKDYKEGVNIARSMTEQRVMAREMEFGVWGTFEYLEYDLSGMTLSSTRDSDDKSNDGLTFVRDKWFMIESPENYTNVKLLQMDVKGTSFVNTGIGFLAYSNNDSQSPKVYTLRDYLVICERARISVYDSELNLLGQINTTVNNTSFSPMIDVRNNAVIYLGFNNRLLFAERFVIDRQGGIAKTGENTIKTYTNNEGFVGNAKIPYAIHPDGKITVLVRYVNWDNTGIPHELRAYQFHPEQNGAIKEVTVKNAPTGSGISGIGYLHNDQLHFYYKARATDDLYRLILNENTLETISDERVYDSSPAELFEINANKTVFFRLISSTSNNRVRAIGVGEITTTSLINFSGSITYKRQQKLYADVNSQDNNSFFVFRSDGSSAGIYFFYGKGALGYGAEITKNDIRFKVKPSKEVVTWLQHDEGLTVTEANFGNINLDLSVTDDETQLVGYTTIEQDEVRLTIERDSIDDDVKAYRILGGVS